jgi:osmotically-inducible protein OsmY
VPSLAALFAVAASLAWLLGPVLLPLPAVAAAHAPEDFPSADAQITFKARAALRDADGLTFLNLGVRLRHGVAILWGSVPSSELAQRAVETVRRVPGVTAVKNELAVVPPDGFSPEVLPSISLAPETDLGPLATNPSPGGALVARPGERGPVPGQPTASGQTPAVSLLPPIAGNTTPPVKPRDPPVMLLSPVVPVPSSSPDPEDSSKSWRPVQPSPAIPLAQAVSLAQAVEQVRRADPRFSRLEAEVRDKVVLLRGTVTQGEDTMALAQALARVPGVERVVVEKVQVSPPSRAGGR